MYKKIPGHPNYMISEDGVVISEKTGRVLNQRMRGHYYVVSLHISTGYMKCRSVHRLVAETYLDNSRGYPVVNHKNLDKLDNRLENLEWCTHSDNMRHAHANGAFKKVISC